MRSMSNPHPKPDFTLSPTACRNSPTGCPPPAKKWTCADGKQPTSSFFLAMPMWTTQPSELPSSAACSKPRATGSASCRNPTGTATSAISKSWVGRACFLPLPRAAWTPWSTNTRPTAGCAPKMPTAPMAATTCVRSIPPSSTPKFSNNFSPMCPWCWEA